MAIPDPERPMGPSMPEQEPEPRSPEMRVLRRARDDRIIAGVCSGLGRYLNIDPVLLRIAFIILTLAGGSGILLYLILAIVMPEERPGDPVAALPDTRVSTIRRIAGWTVLLAGVILLVGRFLPGLEQIVWPVLLLAIGAALVAQGPR